VPERHLHMVAPRQAVSIKEGDMGLVLVGDLPDPLEETDIIGDLKDRLVDITCWLCHSLRSPEPGERYLFIQRSPPRSRPAFPPSCSRDLNSNLLLR